jgi:transcriptional regulator with XRE-family HTH domain
MTESDLRVTLGANLKRYRCFRGLSQAKLAEIIDISPNFISDIETGKRWLSSDTLVNLAEALKIEVYEFLKPLETVNDTTAALLTQYTEEASASLAQLVTHSLDNLLRRYLQK